MTRFLLFIIFSIALQQKAYLQNYVPLDTLHWEINAQSYILENYKGKDAIYIQRGLAFLKDEKFLNGTIEFDVYLTKRQGFPGVRFRTSSDRLNMESFYLRAHLPNKPDSNQAIPVINGMSPWQLYFGPSYSVPFDYDYNDWTHVKLVINGKKAQAYLDYSEKPNLSWNLVHEPKEGGIAIGGGGAGPMHYANFKLNKEEYEIVDFNPAKRKPIQGLIQAWEVSDKFEEKQLDNLNTLKPLIAKRKWGKKIRVEEGTAANIARQVVLNDGTSNNTVFAKIRIISDKDQTKLFEFGYSDRVVAILNDTPLYKGSNQYRSRDYRYLGTIGLFDAIYLDLKKGENILLMAVSETFGGWLITGKFKDLQGITIKYD
ncbi:hypothetical protein U6A24_13490 [Aquimarina gracilis]|uniref:3-keto-disaccharide hydrolase domain-containing protein n=1 Tax=Aquimarina gracilis TaxID=874422 RepID=A0ABU5ZXB9_9FLAO|nr:hypothetical protein [Aquimarina gracilis]MEB3346485.1 hypothetical protein [Aquimarina gracilis]